jgi:hypothetical protein
MVSYHVFSTKDCVNWTDHGRVFDLADAKWAASHMWAIDATYRHGKYYLVYCAVAAADGIFRTGIAVSDRPEGPFTDLGPVKGVDWGQDPALYVDDNDVPWLFWGSGGKGQWSAGDGTSRTIRFRQTMECAILSQHRQIPPRGLNGGGDGQVGKTLVRRLDGRFEELKGSDQTVLKAGEAVTVIPPTAGGFGKA